jgi:phenylalanyl-tRNA synthetase beta chain
MAQYLRGLGLGVERAVQAPGRASSEIRNPKSEIRNIKVTVPSFRPDLTQEIDIVEEVARLHGYEKIRLELAPSAMRGKLSPELQLEQRLRSLLLGLGLTETRAFSLDSPSVFDKLRIPQGDQLRNAPRIRNPESEDFSVMRTTLLGSLLATVHTNVDLGLEDVHVFEIGRIYLPSAHEQPLEQRTLGIAMRGNPWTSPRNVFPGATAYSDFSALKGIVEQVVMALARRGPRFSQAHHPSLAPGRCAAVLVDDRSIGIAGEACPDVLEAFGIPARSADQASRIPTGGVVLFEMNLDALFQIAEERAAVMHVRRPSRFPPARRDIAIVVHREVQAGGAEDIIRENGGGLLERVSLFDVYDEGPQLPHDHKNLAFSLVFRHPEKTLAGPEIEEIMTRIRDALVEQLGAKIREW